MDFFLVKLKKANVEPKHVVFDEWPTLDELCSAIVDHFQIPRGRVTITYRNAEKQFIDLINDEALHEVYKSLNPRCKFITFVVQDSQVPDSELILPQILHVVLSCCLLATISSTWSAGSHLSDLSTTGAQVFPLCCWVFKTSDQPFTINTALNETVDNLKHSIKTVLQYPHPYFKLLLWKVSAPAVS